MTFENVKTILKNIVRWVFVIFFVAGGCVCVVDYNLPFVGILWCWTAIAVSPLPTRLRDSLGLKISDRAINNIMWIMVAASVALVLIFR